MKDVQYPTLPRFIWGHNPVVTHARPKPPNDPCLCGCGLIPKTPGNVYRAGHNCLGRELSAESRRKIALAHTGERSHRYGKRPPNWKGGRLVHSNGYIQLLRRDHPFASKGYVMEHRLVMERHLRENAPASPYLVDVGGVLYVRPEIEVHHLNGVKDDNRPENLQCLTKAQHASEHARLRSEAKGAA